MSSAKQFGPFVLDRMIGRGGMGAVYRATNEETGQIVAVKALLLPLEQERERFEAEISTLRLLRHENIVKLYGFGQEDGVLYYAMEYVDGPSLSTLLKRGRRFTWEEVAYIGQMVCRALKHAHDRGVVHRDVKPANILLISGGGVKVSDYGIAQYFGASRLTNANQVVGTIEYMAPEQAQAGAVTPKTDMYSLGALMYALLTGKPPYQATNLPELLQQFRKAYPERPKALRPEIPRVLEDVVLDLLSVSPEKRPGDARIIGRRLQAILTSSPNCVDGNPFLNQRVAVRTIPTPPVPSDSEATNSRVDLENPSDDAVSKALGAQDDFAPEEVRAPDFPYRPIGQDPSDEEDYASPFDKTTELASNDDKDGTSSEKILRPEDERDDFFLNGSGENDTEQGRFDDRETSTRLVLPSEKEKSDVDVPFESFDDKVVFGARSANDSEATMAALGAYDYSSEGAGVPPRTMTDSATNASTDFEVAYESGGEGTTGASSSQTTRATDSAAAGETLASDAVNVPTSDEFELSDRKEILAKAREHGVGVVLQGRGGTQNAANPSSETAYDSSVNVPRPRRALVEPQSSPAPVGKNLPFEELDVVEDDEATPLERFKKSQFTPVDEDELGDLPTTEPEEPYPYPRFRFMALVLALAAVLYLILLGFLHAYRPSADYLFSRFDDKLGAARATDLNAALRRCEKDMSRFIKNYPDDPRAAKVNYFLSEMKVDELDMRLERQLSGAGRAARQSPLEREYLEARRVAASDHDLGVKKLRAFIEFREPEYFVLDVETARLVEPASPEVGASRGKKRANRWKEWSTADRAPSTDVERLVVVAYRRLAELERETAQIRAEDYDALKLGLEAARSFDATNPDRARRIRAAARELYGDYPWASPLLDAEEGHEVTVEPEEAPAPEFE